VHIEPTAKQARNLLIGGKPLSVTHSACPKVWYCTICNSLVIGASRLIRQ